MSVYVDDAKNEYRVGGPHKMVMSHMIADSHEELMAMAWKLRLADKWIQAPGTQKEHFDIAQSKRTEAISEGAKAITVRELVMKIAERDMSVYQRPPGHWPDVATR